MILEHTTMEGEINIDYIVNSLYQLNESHLRLNLLTEYNYDRNRQRINIVNKQYEGTRQLRYFERMYTDLKENEIKLSLLIK